MQCATQYGLSQGAFSHSARTARIITPMIALFVPVTPLQTTPPTEAGMIHSTQHRGCRIQDPGTCGKHQTKKTKSLVYQQGL